MAHHTSRSCTWLITCCWIVVWTQTCARPSSAARGVLQAGEAAASALANAAPVHIDAAHFRSQIGQDAWVLETTRGQPGYFMDMGARDGEIISNSYALERHGWHGICIEPFPKNFPEAKRTCTVAMEVVTNHTGDVLTFVRPSGGGASNIDGDGLGGLVDTIAWPEVLTREGTTYANVTSISVRDLLNRYNIPKVIDYWSLDVEGGEHIVLKAFPFCEYHVKLLTVEHNSREPMRSQIRDLLEHHGFVVAREVEYDDWYVNKRPPPSVATALPAQVLDASARSLPVPPQAASSHTQHVSTIACFAIGIVAGAMLHKLLHTSGPSRKISR